MWGLQKQKRCSSDGQENNGQCDTVELQLSIDTGRCVCMEKGARTTSGKSGVKQVSPVNARITGTYSVVRTW
jgi:hypothetical protein